MIDIVEKLRTRYKVKCNRCLHFNSDMTTVHETMDEAADEIERLRLSQQHELIEAGRTIADWLGKAVNGPGSCKPFQDYRLPGQVEEAMRLITGSHDEQP